MGLPLALAMALCTLLAVGARTRYLHVELRISMLLKVRHSRLWINAAAAAAAAVCLQRVFQPWAVLLCD